MAFFVKREEKILGFFVKKEKIFQAFSLRIMKNRRAFLFKKKADGRFYTAIGLS